MCVSVSIFFQNYFFCFFPITRNVMTDLSVLEFRSTLRGSLNLLSFCGLVSGLKTSFSQIVAVGFFVCLFFVLFFWGSPHRYKIIFIDWNLVNTEVGPFISKQKPDPCSCSTCLTQLEGISDEG